MFHRIHIVKREVREGCRLGSLRRLAFALMMLAVAGSGLATTAMATGNNNKAMIEEAVKLGEEFRVVVGEVDEETRAYLGLQRAEGVVVYEVIAGRPADLAGIRVKAVIKEIDKHEIRTLADFGRALKTAMQTENFTVATYEAPDPVNPGLASGVNFHPPSQEATAAKPWRTARRVPAEALAKAGCFGGFRRLVHRSLGEGGSSDGRHGCEAVGLHFVRTEKD